MLNKNKRRIICLTVFTIPLTSFFVVSGFNEVNSGPCLGGGGHWRALRGSVKMRQSDKSPKVVSCHWGILQTCFG